jgi:FtsH-binding integral membrane protein
MNDSQSFAKAQLDPVFRRQQIDEHLYRKTMSLGLIILVTTAWLAYAAYCAFMEHRWSGASPIFTIIIGVLFYTQSDVRLKALKALGEPVNHRP